MNFLSTFSDKKSCNTSTTLQNSVAQFVSDSWASCSFRFSDFDFTWQWLPVSFWLHVKYAVSSLYHHHHYRRCRHHHKEFIVRRLQKIIRTSVQYSVKRLLNGSKILGVLLRTSLICVLVVVLISFSPNPSCVGLHCTSLKLLALVAAEVGVSVFFANLYSPITW